jgi:H+/Cl- antiporter ClcA
MLRLSVAIALIGLIAYIWLFVKHFRVKDGIGRLYMLNVLGALMVYFAVCFVTQVLYYGLNWIDALDVNDVNRYNRIILIIPAVLSFVITYWHKRKG